MRRSRSLLAGLGLATLGLATLAPPALAEPRWLACKFNDASGKPQTFVTVFDDIRGTVALLEGRELVDGASTSINFQSIRTRFPQFNFTYNRNDGSMSLSTGSLGGIMTGECRRTAPPPGAPQP